VHATRYAAVVAQRHAKFRGLRRFDQLGGIHPERVGKLPGRLRPYEVPAAMLKAVDRLCRNAGLFGQLTDTQPAGGP
jgi:hypothetical protein